MPAVLRQNAALELNLVEYQGAVTLAELKALAAFMAHNPQHLQRDTLTFILPGSNFRTIEFSELDQLFAYYAQLFAPLKLQIMRRGAWLCLSPDAEPHLRHWLQGDTRGLMSSNVRAFSTLADAADWLLLNEQEQELVRRGDGFNTVARFTAPAPAR